MHYKVFKHVFKPNILENIYKYYLDNTDSVHSTNGMYKIENPWDISYIRKMIEPVLKDYFNTDLPNIGDNIYKHNNPYFPHVDLSIEYPCFNVLIPVKVADNIEQKFCIFDQYVNDTSMGATWVGEWYDTMKDFEHNKKRRYIFNDETVEGSSQKDIDDRFYEDYLASKGRKKSLFKGLTGIAVDFAPGDLILFDSKYIHATGKMDCEWKIGLSLRFKGDFYEEVR